MNDKFAPIRHACGIDPAYFNEVLAGLLLSVTGASYRSCVTAYLVSATVGRNKQTEWLLDLHPPNNNRITNSVC